MLQVNHPSWPGYDGWNRAVLFYLREHMDSEYEEVINWTEEMERIGPLLDLDRSKFPHPTRCVRHSSGIR